MIHSPKVVDQNSIMQILIQVGKVNGEYASGFELNLPEDVDVHDMNALIDHIGYVKQNIQSVYEAI